MLIVFKRFLFFVLGLYAQLIIIIDKNCEDKKENH